MKKKILMLVCCLAMAMGNNIVYAAECEEVVVINDDITSGAENEENALILVETLTRGASKPSSNASVHDLDVNDYNFQLADFGYQLFTDKWLTSDSGYITVNLTSFSLLESYGGTSNKITFKLCDSSGVLVTSEKTVVSGTASETWKNISSSKKYYVCFEVPTNGNRYTGAGYITN